ncbi:TcpQ domain-containing protein [Frateuria sp. STR12]|uniref:TcpQ domain-containing protein n=1 Tax=Frateuria hangzhouensis TaxID=2995589 RepID=UPI0022609FAE|nr:TcpQ domain-containing protein [Frateuria sp. STR12]
MNKVSPNRILGTLLPALLLAGCGTPAAKDFGGHWKPVNRFQSSTTEIPLNRPYTYYASPMDETLRTMLIRWTSDTGMTLVYRMPSDYTLFAPVTKVRTGDIRQAASKLSAIYAAQGVSITVADGRLQVDRARTLGSRTKPRDPVAPSQAATERTTTASPETSGGAR